MGEQRYTREGLLVVSDSTIDVMERDFLQRTSEGREPALAYIFELFGNTYPDNRVLGERAEQFLQKWMMG
jgi:hypothetical protein